MGNGTTGTSMSSKSTPGSKKDKNDDVESDDEGASGKVDHASTAALLSSAAEYMKKNDYVSALQIYNYARNTCKEWETPLIELKVLSNTSLCLQRIRGRLPDLIAACNEAIARIEKLQGDGGCGVEEAVLLRMTCACLS